MRKNIQKYNIILFIIIIISIFAISFSGCTDTEKSDSNMDNTDQKLVIGETWDLDSIDPALSGNDFSNFLLTEGLTAVTSDFKIIPSIASSWNYSGNNVWQFKINKDIKFHDGSFVTPTDIKSSLERSIKHNPELAGRLNIKEIKIIDDSTIDIITNTPDASTPARMAYGGATIYKVNENKDESISTPIGTGPFKFVSFNIADQKLELSKNQEYRHGSPKLNNITIKFGIGDSNTREMAVQSGEVDFTTETPLGSTKRLQEDQNLNTMIHPLCQGYILKFGNISKAPYDDVRIRKAIAHSVDSQKIVDNVLLGRGIDSKGNALSHGLPWRNDNVTGYPYDIQKSKDLLAEAGWKDTDGDGIIDKDGQKFKITLYTWPQRPALPPLAQATQSMLKDIGIDSEVRIMEWDAISERKEEWGMITVGGGNACMMIPDPSYYIEGHFMSVRNDYKYNNPEVDALIMKGRTTFDTNERYNAYREIQKIVYDQDCAEIPLAQHYLMVVSNKKVEGYVPNPSLHDWGINKDIYIK